MLKSLIPIFSLLLQLAPSYEEASSLRETIAVLVQELQLRECEPEVAVMRAPP